MMIECKECPYIRDEYDVSKKYGYQYYDCWCDKIGGKIKKHGVCWKKECGDDDLKRKTKPQKRKRNTYYRDKFHKDKLKKIFLESAGYPYSAFPVFASDEDFDKYLDGQKDYKYKYFKRGYRANHAPGYSGHLKKLASRAFRRYKGELANGCAYKKTFDYWWELW